MKLSESFLELALAKHLWSAKEYNSVRKEEQIRYRQRWVNVLLARRPHLDDSFSAPGEAAHEKRTKTAA